MSEDKWWGKEEKKESSKETIEEMMNHTEMMRIKREEEMAQAQHEAELSRLKDETIVAKANDSPPVTQEPPRVQANKGLFDWMTDDPGYLFLTIIVALGFVGMIIGGSLTPSVDEKWETTEGIVLEGTEWWEDEIEFEDCLYDEYYDEYYDCIYTYTYDCGADVYYNYTVNGITYFEEYYDYFLGNWNDYCLEIVQNETLPVNSSVMVWYEFENEDSSTLEEPSELGPVLFFIAFCCLLPMILGLIFIMYFEGNNEQYNQSSGDGEDVHIHHHHHGGGALLGGVYYGTTWHRRPWFHRRRSRRITRRTRSTRTSGSSSRSGGGGSRRSGGGGSRRSGGGGSRRSGGGRRSR
jgi:hypothetical protein